MKKINFFRVFLIAFLSSFAISLLLRYPFKSFQLEDTDKYGYEQYQETKLAYENYVKKHDCNPTNLDFLPQEIKKNIGIEGYPIVYEEKSGDLIYRYPKPQPIGKVNLLYYLFPSKWSVLGVPIGQIEMCGKKKKIISNNL